MNLTYGKAAARRLLLPALVAALAVVLMLPGMAAAGKGGQHGKGQQHGTSHNHGQGHGHFWRGFGKGKAANVTTRNIYLGANLTPAIVAPTLPEFVAANGQILREVTQNDFPTRAKGLAAEILSTQPDLVGLQEVALWRTAPPSLTPVLTGVPSASTVRYDYLAELLAELNRGPDRYEVVVVQEEFDLEAPADENGVAGDGPNPAIADAEINGRLTMRDVILRRLGAGVHTMNPQSANFATNLVVPVAGVPVTVKRGWTATDAKVRGSGWFRFVNTHLEAFQPLIRAAQAAELVAPTGPATGQLPVVLVGDLNSDDDTVEGADRLAYETLLAAGFVNRSTDDPLSCCLDSSLLAEGAGGSVADFDHQVDHVLTDEPRIDLLRGVVTGLFPVNGFWNSDHAGVTSALSFR